MEPRRFYHWNICKIYDKGGTDGDAGRIAGIFGEVRREGCHASTLRAPCSFCFCLQRRAFVNEERGIPGRPKVPVLTSHAGLNSRSCTALSLAASFVSSKSRLVIFILCTQPYRWAGNPPSSGTREHSSRYHGFVCQPLRGLVTKA